MVSGISEIVLLFLSAPLAVFLPSFYRNCIFHICSVALAEIGRIFTREGAAKVQLFLKYANEY